MIAVGFHGGFDTLEHPIFNLGEASFHDAAAALLVDGKLVSAVEEERLNRIKHTNLFPAAAVAQCLALQGISASQVDVFAFRGSESWLRSMVKSSVTHREYWNLDPKMFLASLLSRELKSPVKPQAVQFYGHHECHARSVYHQSGFGSALIVVLDAEGDGVAGMIFKAVGNELTVLRTIPVEKSIGLFYLDLIKLIGFHIFEEYKVMGLAPYGDPGVFRQDFARTFRLLTDGDFEIRRSEFHSLRLKIAPPKHRKEIAQIHMDFAAALQEAFETIIMHAVSHFSATVGESRLCYSGGVAHNSVFNGRLIACSLFRSVYVDPAAHDAGGAIGAAYSAAITMGAAIMPLGAEGCGMFLGRSIGSDASRVLSNWGRYVRWRPIANNTREIAELLAGGAVVSLARGRSEFGPRALGHRSILADARPFGNRERINAITKMRESFRPFAPIVLGERAREFFTLPDCDCTYRFMNFVVKVRTEMIPVLGAVTHVDGTARMQTVERHDDEFLWAILREFGEITGVPVLLNTSFNNKHEPIVESEADAIRCFLSTDIDYLILGDYLVERIEGVKIDLLDHYVETLPGFTCIAESRLRDGRRLWRHKISSQVGSEPPVDISQGLYSVLVRPERSKVGDALKMLNFESGIDLVEQEIWDLWRRRYIDVDLILK